MYILERRIHIYKYASTLFKQSNIIHAETFLHYIATY